MINQQMADRFWPHQMRSGSSLASWVRTTAARGRRSSGSRRPASTRAWRGSESIFSDRCFRSISRESTDRQDRGNQPIADTLRHEVRVTLDPRMALTGLETLEQHMQLPLFRRARRPPAWHVRTAGAHARPGGLYGVMSYSVRAAHARDWGPDGAWRATSRRPPPHRRSGTPAHAHRDGDWSSGAMVVRGCSPVFSMGSAQRIQSRSSWCDLLTLVATVASYVPAR